MRDIAFDLLVSRLRWPIPRIRWETARAIADLVRSGHEGARQSLVDWIAGHRLESEALLGLGVIDAFELGSAFDRAELEDAIGAPSLLSDWLLDRSFPGQSVPDRAEEGPGRYGYAPDADIILPEGEDAWFARYRRSAVPPLFSHALDDIRLMTGLPMRARWEHEWRWLQRLHKASGDDIPRYFFPRSDRDGIGQYDNAQREIYVSAFLRTLHWAMGEWGVPRALLLPHATIALTLTRGLADIAPVRRPAWARAAPVAPGDLQGDPGAEAQALWDAAAASLAHGRELVALDIVDAHENGFAHFRFRLAALPAGTEPDAPPRPLPGLELQAQPGTLAGRVGEKRALVRVTEAAEVAEAIGIDGLGRGHVDLAGQTRILSPYLVGTTFALEARPRDLVARTGRRLVSGWRYWYADWRPALPRMLDTRISSLAWARSDALASAAKIQDLHFAVAVTVHRGARADSFRELETSIQRFWLD